MEYDARKDRSRYLSVQSISLLRLPLLGPKGALVLIPIQYLCMHDSHKDLVLQ